jgi:hypothetical protein
VGKSQRVNTLDELKARITTEIANVTKDMLQPVWQEVDHRVYAELQMALIVKCFEPDSVSTYVLKKLFQLMNKIMQRQQLVSIFFPKVQVPEISAFFFIDIVLLPPLW